MKIDLADGRSVGFIPDPHLGRSFQTGVPIHRRGERERMQLLDYQTRCYETGLDYNVMVGDLMDHPFVSYGVIAAAAKARLYGAKQNPDTRYIDMAGNHDRSRNLAVVSAWDVYCEIVNNRLPNLIALSKPAQIGPLALFPWEWGVSALEQVACLNHDGSVEVVVGHWDLQSFGGDDSHIAPTKALRERFGTEVRLYSGHYHLPGTYDVDGIEVVCTGSMQPYTHAEDPEETRYITLSADQALARADELHDHCVRILLKEGETMPEIDCLALTAKRVTDEKVAIDTVSMGDFDWSTVLNNALQDLVPEVRTFITERMGSYD